MKLKDLLVEAVFDVSQQDLLAKVKAARTVGYIKNVVGALVKTSALTPDALSKINLGGVDKTGYDEDYIAKNPYTLIQMTKNGPEAYQPSISVLKAEYMEAEATADIQKAVQHLPVEKFVVKKTIVQMALASDLGITPGSKIESPWGDTQDVGQGAFIVNGGTEAYVVNAQGGLPIGYIKA